MINPVFLRLVVPGIIFQSAMIGGGYATGRELVEYFLSLGPVSSLLALGVAMVAISVICAVSFEYSRRFRLYDYRLFFKHLLGRAWVLFEIAYVALILLILSVLGAAANELLASYLDVPPVLGSLALMAAVGGMVFWGPVAIRNILSAWSVLLYLSYGLLIVWSLWRYGDSIADILVSGGRSGSVLATIQGGATYAGYNIVLFTTALFMVRQFQSPREAVVAGLLCGPLCLIPGLMFLVAMMAHYPAIVSEPLPISFVLDALNAPALLILFQVVIFGTFIETGTALLHSVNERISHVFEEHAVTMPRTMRPTIAVLIMALAIFAADRVGIIALVGQGYSYATYVVLLVYILPLMTLGIRSLYNARALSPG